MNYEQQYYQVPGGQLGWRVTQARQQGLDYDVIRQKDGMYIIVVMAPVGSQPFAYETHLSHRPGFHLPAFNWRSAVQSLCVFAMIGALSYIAYGMMAGGAGPTIAGVPVEVGGMKLDPTTGRGVEPSLWEQAQGALGGLLPSGAQPQAAPQTDTGWTWPPKNPVGDAIDGTMEAVTWLTYAVIVVGVLAVLSFVFGMINKFRR